MGRSLISKMFRIRGQREKKQQEIFVFSFVQKEGQSSSIVLSPYLDDLRKPRSEARESETQGVETRREDGPEVVQSEDDMWALSADFTCRHHETDEITMLRTKKPSRCH